MTETRSHQIQMTTEQLRRLRQAELGRKTDLNCRHLLVEFRPGSSRQGGAGQMSLGELRQVQARGEVLLDDSQWFVTGDRLDYVDDSGLVSVYGPAGQDAYISGLDDQASQVFEAKCPQLHLELKTGAVDAPGCKVRYRSGGAGQ